MKDETIRKIFSALTNDRGRRLIKKAQDRWLRQQIPFTVENSPFYKEKFSELGLDPADIRSVSDLAKLGFFTYPSDLQEDPFKFLAIPREDILYPMSSTGTTGKKKIVFMSESDWRIATRSVGNGMSMMGVKKEDVTQILFCYGTPSWMTGSLIQSGLERVGAFVLPTGNGLPIREQISIMKQFGTTMLLGTPSYLHRLTEEASVYTDLKSIGVRLIRLGAEPWSETLRTYLQDAWGAQVYDSYGMMELGAVGGGECSAQDGIHLSPYLITEIVDPKSGRLLPRGEVGELVYTLVQTEGSPLIRYRSGDQAKFMPDEVCTCGELPTERISRILGRSDDMLFLGSGENAYPSHFESAIVGIEGISAFQVIIEKQGYKDLLTFRVESNDHTEELKDLIFKRLSKELPFLEHEILQSKMIAPLEFDFINPGTLNEEFPVKIRHLIDRRNNGDS